MDADVLYLPQASGYMIDGKPRLLASMERYTRIQINGHAVLMRDDALRAFREENKFYDYGILIQVSDQANGLEDLKKVQHPSIKLLSINSASSSGENREVSTSHRYRTFRCIASATSAFGETDRIRIATDAFHRHPCG